MPIGSLVQGTLIDVIGPQWTVAGAGVLFLAVFAGLRFGTDLFVHMDDVPNHERGGAEELRLDVAESEAVEAAVEGR